MQMNIKRRTLKPLLENYGEYIENNKSFRLPDGSEI
jgi:hypothetical protein